mmetsp:Transcript_4249/g.3570  ORF Transcript_4249/g.3570 Transcript_4249/m.3570 type:complete len:226 (-) Transcript_4249:106-783(-)
MDSKKTNIEQGLDESAKEFADQFDPKSKTYHGGDKTPVPIGGEKIPNSMPTAYDAEYIKQAEQAQEIDYGDEYRKLMELRTALGDLKKTLNLVCPPLEACLRHKAKDQEESKKEKLIEEEMKKVTEATAKLEKFIKLFKGSHLEEKYNEGLELICKDAFKKFENKEQYTDFSFIVKKYTSTCFNDQKEILDKIKKIKADYTKKNKENVDDKKEGGDKPEESKKME